MRRRLALFVFLSALLVPLAPGAHASRHVPPPPPAAPAPGVVPTEAPGEATPDPAARAGGFHRAAAAGETVYVFSDSLESRSSPDGEGGFTHYDSSIKPTAWHIDTFLGCQGNAMWCGLIDSSWVYDSNRAGYDNDWTQYLQNRVDLFGVAAGTPVTLGFKHRFDAEPDYDYGFIEVLDPEYSWIELGTYTGRLNNGNCDSVTVTIPDSVWTKYYTDSLNIPPGVVFRFEFTSDVGWSSADGLYDGDGWVVDNVTVKAGGAVRFFDAFNAGMGTWEVSTFPGVGDYFWLLSNVVNEDQCSPDHGKVWVDWDPIVQSLVPRLDNFVVTPPIATGRASEVFAAFDVYRNLPLDGCFFYHLNFRTRNVGDAEWGPWTDPTNFVYYGANKDWARQRFPLPGAGNKDSVQVQLGLRDYSQVFCGGVSSPGGIYSFFDNIAVGVIGSAPPSFVSRDIDLFQDTFHTVPFMFRDDNVNTPLGDSVVVQVNASQGYKQGFLHYRLNGGSFSAVPLAKSAPALANHRYADLPAGSYAAGTTVEYYFSATDSLDVTSYLPANAPTTQRYFSASILPLKSATNPALGCTDSLAHVLFVNHFAGRETESYIATALKAWGYKFDTWDVNGPSSGIGNSPGGSRTPDSPQYYWPATDVGSLLQYSTIVWHSGNLTSYTITQEDQAIIQSWIQQPGRDRNFWITGDDVAYELTSLGQEYNAFLGFTCGARYLRDVWENMPKDTLHPMVQGVAGAPSAGRSFHVNGDCPILNDFDLVTTSSQAASGKSGLFLRYPNTFAAATRYATQYVPFGTDSARVIFQAFSFNSIEEGGERLQLAKAILQTYFKESACYYATAVEGDPAPSGGAPRVRDALEQNAPNPFNPQTVIGYSVSAPGRAEIRIFGAGGALVRRFVEHPPAAGHYAVRWNGTDESGRRLASGVYFYEIETRGGYRAARKMLLLK
jgi:hypothetical protein